MTPLALALRSLIAGDGPVAARTAPAASFSGWIVKPYRWRPSTVPGWRAGTSAATM